MMRFLHLCLLFTCLFGVVDELQGADNRVRFVYQNGRRYVFVRDIASYYGLQPVFGKRTLTLQSRYAKILMTYEKQSGFINNQSVTFFLPPLIKGGEYYISEQDFLYFIDPILRDRSIPQQHVRTIMLDAGHGGQDTGGRGMRYMEKDVALSMVKKVKYFLEKAGFRVILTRSTDTFIPLEGRMELCRRYRPDLFVAIHTNAAVNRSICGIETFIMPPAGINSTYGAHDLAYEANNRYDINNTRLGYELHRSLLDRTGAFDRGIKRARFYVVKNAVCPSVLLELGFITNRFEERLLGDNAYQDKLAQAIAAGIINYARVAGR